MIGLTGEPELLLAADVRCCCCCCCCCSGTGRELTFATLYEVTDLGHGLHWLLLHWLDPDLGGEGEVGEAWTRPLPRPLPRPHPGHRAQLVREEGGRLDAALPRPRPAPRRAHREAQLTVLRRTLAVAPVTGNAELQFLFIFKELKVILESVSF